MIEQNKPWRESASLIIIGENSVQLNEIHPSNYKILMMERSQNSSFIPNVTVFPGGSLDNSDKTPLWLEHYKKLGITNDKFNALLNIDGPRPDIFQQNDDDLILKEISLRICAIRETFEEVGILLCKTKNEFNSANNFSKIVTKFNIKFWQKKVHDDPKQFIQLCMELNVAPDLWNLYEWSLWLTPSIFPKRFETAFFIVALRNQPALIGEQTEVKKCSWQSLENLIRAYATRQILLTNPQIYELSRLHNFIDINELTQFAKQRSPKGMQLLFPTQYMVKDTFVSILPGDDFYPIAPDLWNPAEDIQTYINERNEDFRKRARNLHRIETTTGRSVKIISNIKPMFGHLSPVRIWEISKL